MTNKDKEKVLQILYDCIVKPAIDEDDVVFVDYYRAKSMIMRLEAQDA